jgi:hypothetical protein
MDGELTIAGTALLTSHFAIAPAGQVVANVKTRDGVVRDDVGDLKPGGLLPAAMMVNQSSGRK